MPKYIRIPLTIIIVWALFFDAKAQSIFVKTSEGTGDTIQTSLVQNFTFRTNSLLQKKTDGSSVSYSLSAITKIYFISEATGIDNLSANKTATTSFYPNPANTIIYFQNIPAYNSVVSIFSIDGKLILQTRISADNNSINVSTLESGLYLLKVNNRTFKLIKQ